MKTALLIVLQLVASGSDAYFTDRNARTPKFGEADPIAKPFVRTTADRVAFFSSGAAVQVVVPAILRKHHHERLAEVFSITGIADNAAGAAYSAIH